MEIYTDSSPFPFSGSVVTTGTFDGVHKGHKFLVDKALQISNTLQLPMVAVTFWPHPRTVTGSREVALLSTLDEKLELLGQAGAERVLVWPFSAGTAALSATAFLEQLVARLHMRHLVIGANHRMGHLGQSDAPGIRARAGALGVTTDIAGLLGGEEHICSSGIRQMLQRGDMAGALSWLGHPYLMTGTVDPGDRIGRTLGFPTANLDIPDFKLVPADGVYAVRVTRNGLLLPGMMYIGHRPTLHEENARRRVEVHLFHFDGDLYGQRLHVECLARLRGDVRCASLKELQQLLQHDAVVCQQFLNNQSTLSI